MKKKTLVFCSPLPFVLTLCIGASMVVQAAETLINFDDVAGGTLINTHYPGVTFTNPIGGNIVARSGAGSAPSAPNVVCITNGGVLPFFDSPFGAVDARFATPVRVVKIDARPVSQVADHLDPTVARPYLQAFDASGNLLGTVYYAGALPQGCCYEVGATETLTYASSTANIARVRFSSQQPVSGVHTYGMFDNLRFDDGYYTLLVSITGNGSVTAVPSQASYFYGTVVNLTATPATDWAFSSWWNFTDSIIGSANPLAVTMNADKNIGYYFYSLDQSEPNFVVTTADDHNDGVAGVTDCTLREAINAANAFTTANTITFATNVTGVITLKLGELTINHDLSIIGPGAKTLAITVSNISSSVHISGGAVAAISGLSIGNVVVGFNAYVGMTIDGGSTLLLNACNVSGFRDTGIFNGGTLSLNNCTITGNSGDAGGGIRNYGLLGVTNSTISGNSAGHGGGIYNHPTGSLTLNSTTICSNTIFGSIGGGGIQNNSGIVNVRNSIIAANTNAIAVIGPDCIGSFNSLGYNLVGKTNDSSGFSSASQDQFGSIASPVNPLLGPLADNGGPTFTHRPLPDSPAVDKGNSFGLITDQRDRLRPCDLSSVANASSGDGSDIGAYELNLPVLSIVKSLSNVVLSWSTDEAGYTLESAAQPTAPPGWATVSGVPSIIGSQYTLTTNTAAGRQFYRLRSP